MTAISEYKIRTGQPMSLVGEPVFVTAVSSASAGMTFVESYVFLPVPKQVIWRRARIAHPDQNVSQGIPLEIDFDECIFDQARIDYELFMSKNFPEIYKGLFHRRQNWGDYFENSAAMMRLRLRGLFGKEIQAVSESAKCKSLRDHFQELLRYHPIRMETFEEDLG